MPWVEVFAVFIVCHLAGDYLIQTNWQAAHKHGGLGPDPTARRALISHVTTYTLAFSPALLWLALEIEAKVVAVAALIFIPLVFGAVDQSFHVLTLFGVSLLAGN